MPRLQDVILRGLSGAKPLATAVSVGTLYYSTDTATTERSNGLIWETYSDVGSSGLGNITTVISLPGYDGIDGEDGFPGIPGQAGPQGIQGIPGPAGPAGSGSGSGIAGVSIPFFPEIEEHVCEPQIFPQPSAASGSVGITTAQKTRQIGITVDGGGNVLTTGVKGYKSFPVAGTITGVRLLADVAGAIVMDIWKDTYANYPPVVGDSITAAAKPTIPATNIKAEDVTLTGWNTTVNAGDVFGFSIDSITTITKIILELTIVVT